MNWTTLRQHRHALGITIAVAAVALATGVFVVRTAMQPHYKPCDFAAYYVASRAWLMGENPYDRAMALELWVAAGGDPKIMPQEVGEVGLDWLPVLQLPPTFPALWPLALLSARLAVSAWYILCFGLLLAQTAALASMMGSSLMRPRGLLLLAATLLLAPVHENFGWAQPSAPAISLIVLGVWAAARRSDITGGVLLALATALKPQLGGFFFLYYLFVTRARFAIAFVAVMMLLGGVALSIMALHGTPWLSGWLENLRLAESPGGFNSTSSENADRSYLLNLQVILNGLLHSRWIVNAAAAVITVALAIVFVWKRERMRRRDELLCASAVAILALLPVYHRFYDAAILVLPLAWSIAHLRGQALQAWGVLLFVGTFAVPYAAIRRVAELFGEDFPSMSGAVWDLLIEPVRVWILLGGFACLMLAMRPRQLRPQFAVTWPRAFSDAGSAWGYLRWLAATRSAAVPCAWMLALILAVLLDGTILRFLKPYAAAVSASSVTHELKEIGHIVFVLLLAGFVAVLHPLRWRAASLLIWTAVIAKLLYAVTKASMVRPRPIVAIAPYYVPGLEEVTSRLARMYEFFWPSGHTIVAFATAAAMEVPAAAGTMAVLRDCGTGWIRAGCRTGSLSQRNRRVRWAGNPLLSCGATNA